MNNNGPHLPQAAQQALSQAWVEKQRRIKLVNRITARMGAERGEQYLQYDINGNVRPYRFGFPTLPPSDPRIHGPSVKYASRYFDSTHLDEAQAKYGGQKHPKGYNIRLKRILGAGGYGFAAHITHKNPKTGFNTDCVIKIEKSRHHGNSALAREEKALWKFVGAQHILQISDITREIQAQRAADLTEYQNSHPPPPAGARLPDPEIQDKNWSLKNFEKQPIRNFVILENANLGDLGLWLSKSSRLEKRWPQRAIWMLFQSLVLGLVGMGYPLREHYEASHPDWEYQKPIDEVFPDDPKVELQETVHFDLDPRNVLLANRSMFHGNFPTFKIADFGLTEFFSEYENYPGHFNKEFFWHCRIRGKPVYYAPEQFTSEWDHVNDLIDDDGINHFLANDGTKPPVAGNYGMHTNIYQVGTIIWCAITLCSFQQAAIRVPYSDAWGRDITTYGGALQSAQFNNVDPELTDLVQRCMAHNPSDRPNLRELVATISNRLARNDLESDDALAAWSRDFFTTPRVPGDEPPRVKREREDEGDDAEGDAGRGASRRAVDDGNGHPVALDVQRVQAWQQGVLDEPLLLDVFQPPVQPQSAQGDNILGQSSNNRHVVAPGYPALSPMPMIKEEPSAAAPVFVGLNNQYNQPAAVNPPGGFDARLHGAQQTQWQQQMPAMQPNNVVNNNYMFNYAAPNPMIKNPNLEAQAGLAA
ncbi:kinase-like domain-containing protein [Colletotrichum acutatum]|uniref:Kinase-like domain-containing protein n=1 Tax=Glomerella acutata TaxID=27357 RepID=A0AAD9D353_GLOAC|nr:kinase-like domain-containing protein [Colletotrichum acutatum]KAK1731933.1 kinase-like domain-containing protein [Colletotrichum acutatum]